MTRAVELAQVASDGVSEVFKNRIINGAMVIDQRNAGASITVSSATNFNVDRFKSSNQTTAVVTAQQVSDTPIGFVNSSRLTVTTADSSIGSTEVCYISQLIEGFNVADLGWGTADAKTVTLSFWVKSSITGLMGGAISNTVRSYPYSYTINSANTWEQKSVTIPGDTSGTWNKTNSIGMVVYFNIGCGSTYLATPGTWVTAEEFGPTGQVNVISTLNATWQITGVQLEVGSQATSFETRSYGTELALCQRYYETAFPVGTAVSPGASYFWYTNVTSYSSTACRSQWIDFKATKRALPTVTPYRTNIVASNDNSWALYNGSTWYNSSSATYIAVTHHGFYGEVTGSGMSGVGYSYICIGAWDASAEL